MLHRISARSARCVSASAVTAIALVASLAGCATTSTDQAAAPREEKVYRTGSNLPTRDGAPSDVKTVDPATITRPRGGTGSPTTGGGG